MGVFDNKPGECQVERDLGTMRAALRAHSTTGTELAEEALLNRCDGPQARSQVVRDEEGGHSIAPRLTDTSREWANLWRQVVRARMGCYNLSAVKACAAYWGNSKKTWRARRTNVLAAAEQSVQESRECGAASAPMTAFGVRRDFFKQAADSKAGTSDSRHWSGKLDNFTALTARKAAHNKLWNIHKGLGPRRGRDILGTKVAPPLGVISSVRFLGEALESKVEVAVGSKKCKRAQLIVVPDLSLLHNSAADKGMVAHLAYIVGLGKAVVTSSAWTLAQGDPAKILPNNIIRHVPAAVGAKQVFTYTPAFRTRYGEVHEAMRFCADKEKSKWTWTKRANENAVKIRRAIFYDLGVGFGHPR